MKSGISRYTLGGFNQSAIDDVYNKAKEIYVGDVVEPPASGVMTNDADVVLNDMTLLNDRKVSNMISSYRQYYTSVNGTFGSYAVNLADEWKKINLWMEVGECQPEGQNISCSPGIVATQNTGVEVSMGDMWILEGKDNNNWKHVIVNKTQGINAGTIDASKDREGVGCDDCGTSCLDALRDQWDAMPGFEKNQSGSTGDCLPHFDRCEFRKCTDNHATLNPQHGRRYVGGPAGNPVIDTETLEGIYGCIWVRLIKLDPDGVDDRHLANQQLCLSSDIKDADGYTINWLSVGSQSRHKLVPHNGDWMPMNFLIYRDEIVSAEKMALNPPPIPTEPI